MGAHVLKTHALAAQKTRKAAIPNTNEHGIFILCVQKKMSEGDALASSLHLHLSGSLRCGIFLFSISNECFRN